MSVKIVMRGEPTNNRWRVTVELPDIKPNGDRTVVHREAYLTTREAAYRVANRWAKQGFPADIDEMPEGWLDDVNLAKHRIPGVVIRDNRK
jgi:hypothetical protein